MSIPRKPRRATDRALVPTRPAEPALDAHGHDPADYQWVPVLRRPRKDGWTPQRQTEFIAALTDTACVTHAADRVGMSVASCYRLRRESVPFAAAWEQALPHAARRLVDVAFDRAIHGSDEPVFDKDGNKIGRRMRQNDRLLMFLLRAYMPDRFRHAHGDVRAAAEPPPPAVASIAEVLLRLEPAAPQQPHLLMAPDDLADALDVADQLGGALPAWHRGRGDAEAVPAAPLGPEFEKRLAGAKRKVARDYGFPSADGEQDGNAAALRGPE